MNTAETVRTQKEFTVARQVHGIVFADTKGKPIAVHADKNGTLPERFELLRVGMWRTPWHGNIMIMPQDLVEYVDNYHEGYGVSGDGVLGLPINFGHDAGGKAAGWFKEMVIEGESLYATEITWSESGKEGLLGDEWKCISAEFYPAGRGGWPDPLDEEHYVENVIDGAALTNIPLFSQLKPVMASAVSGQGDKNNQVFFITASQAKEQHSMTIEDVRVKDADKLTEEEKTFLGENKGSLTIDEHKKFGFEIKAEEKEEPKPADPPADPADVPAPTDADMAAVTADIKSGRKVLVEASTLKGLEDTAKDYRTEKAAEIVKAHIARGAIKADQLQRWTDRLVSASGQARTDLETDLSNLPTQEAMAANQGGDGGDTDASAVDEMHKKTQEKVKASNGKLNYTDAQKELLAEDKDLAGRVNNERAAK